MKAIDWVRSKAEKFDEEEFLAGGEKYRVERFSYRGVLPARMVPQIRKQLDELVQNDLESERIILGGQYRGDYGKCEYIRSVYLKVEG